MTDTEVERKAAEEAFDHGFYNIPGAKKRAKLSCEKLAIELWKCEKDSPPYILLAHELNLRLAREQVNATLRVGWLTALAALAIFVLGQLFGTSSIPATQAACTPAKTAANNTTSLSGSIPH